jgi:hypothetical protein
MTRRCRFFKAAMIVGLGMSGQFASQTAKGFEVDLELLLAVDVSTSVDPLEAELQRNGYVAAFTDPALQQAILDSTTGRIAVSYVEWAGANYQRTVIDWTVIDSAETAAAFAGTLKSKAISSAPSTSISGLIDFARRAFRSNAFQGLRRVIDISGDGPNSAGRSAAAARDDAVAEGITINGLPVLSSRPDPVAGAPATGVERYYRRHVIGGPGAFLLEVAEFENFAPILLKKLIREIRSDVPTAALRQGSPTAQTASKQVQEQSQTGEKSKSQIR